MWFFLIVCCMECYDSIGMLPLNCLISLNLSNVENYLYLAKGLKDVPVENNSSSGERAAQNASTLEFTVHVHFRQERI